MDKIYTCRVTCSFRVKDTLKEFIPNFQETTGFILPDGRTVRPILGLETESFDQLTYKEYTSGADMAALGMDDLEYINSEFELDDGGTEALENEEYEVMPLEQIPANLKTDYESTKKIIERRLKEGK